MGLRVTVNSDDPAYFGGHAADNCLAVAQALNLPRDELARCARHSLEACFAPEARKRAWVSELDACLGSA